MVSRSMPACVSQNVNSRVDPRACGAGFCSLRNIGRGGKVYAVVSAARLAATLLLLGTASAAHPSPSPEALVAALYAAEQKSLAMQGDPPWSKPERFFDASLTRQFRTDALRAKHDGIGNLQFDPLCNGQDCRITRLAILPGRIKGTNARVDVRFHNMGAPRHLVVLLSKRASGWRISDIVETGPNDGWRLSAVLSGSDR